MDKKKVLIINKFQMKTPQNIAKFQVYQFPNPVLINILTNQISKNNNNNNNLIKCIVLSMAEVKSNNFDYHKLMGLKLGYKLKWTIDNLQRPKNTTQLYTFLLGHKFQSKLQ